jgi:translation elongation factor EF-G
MFCVQLIETLADYDEEVAEHFLAEEEIDGALLKSGIRRATLSLEFSPGPHLNDPAAAPYPCHSP